MKCPVTFRPLALWPGRQTANRRPAPFRATYIDTLLLLDRELGALDGEAVVLQIALRADEIRLDGLPRAGSQPSCPGVVLSFESKHGPLSYPCDTFNAWEGNLRAIALALEHLRAVDRYGVTQRGEQYRGWTALPPPATPASPGPTTKTEAVRFLQRFQADVIGTMDLARQAYRKAALALHPDRGGSAEEFRKLQVAKELLGL